MCVCVSVCLYPQKSWEWNIISPHFFPQRKELWLVAWTKCVTSSLLDFKVVWMLHLPFSAVWTYNLRNHAHHLQCRIYQETLFVVIMMNPFVNGHSIYICQNNMGYWVHCKLQVHSWMHLLWTFKVTSLMVKPFMNGYVHVYNHQNAMGYSVHCILWTHSWMGICFPQVLWVIQYNINHGPILRICICQITMSY